ncbi:MAG: hypothetical protein ACPL7L_03380 [bacterium]
MDDFKKGVIKTDLARRIEKVRVRVRIYTNLFLIEGFIYVIPGSRLIDFLNTPGDFIPITDATLRFLPGEKETLQKDFLALRKSNIILLMEAEERGTEKAVPGL